MNGDRNLLFGILALQMDFIQREGLIQAMHGWVLQKTKPLGQILEEQGALSSEQRALLEPLVQAHLKAHDNDPEKSLAAVSSVSALREDLQLFADPDVQASLARLSQGRSEDPSATRVQTTPPPSARFRILRPHARGALGEVFVAEDQELHRQVALKEIRTYHAHSPESRARFLLEAEITGGLEHPGIVPVYGLGHYPDGRPFYAMRFIRGDSLQDAIARFHNADQPGRDPQERNLALRDLLGRFVDVCNAVGYAHARGVLHRDLKPGNVMLGRYGETLVVDWGLAKPLGHVERADAPEGPLEPVSGTDSAPTQMGQAVGTPAYMSPEQAAGRLDQLGPATDIYGLGATLFCLLTGQAPFGGADVVTVLHKVQQGDFPRPRQLSACVPAALEAICLKAMACRPEDRYSSPRALSDDVEHWLADEPVSAYREPRLARVVRWGRRHRPLVAGAAALLLTAVVALAVGIVAVDREKRQTEEQRDIAQANEKEAVAQKKRAIEFRDRALDALRATTSTDVQKLIAEKKDLGANERAYLEAIVQRWLAFAAQEGMDEQGRTLRAEGHYRVADLWSKLGRRDEARVEYVKARHIQQELADQFSTVPAYQQDLAHTHNNLGLLLADLGKRDEARIEYDKARDIQQKLTEDFPDIPAYQQELARTHNNLGALLNDFGKRDAARLEYQQARDIKRKLAEKYPDMPDYQHDLARTHANLGNLLDDLGKRDEARVALEQARDIQQKLAERFPGVPEYRRDLAGFHRDLGIVLARLGKRNEAWLEYEQARDIQQKLAERFPAVPDYRRYLARTHNSLGLLFMDLGKGHEARLAYEQARDIQQKLADQFPGVPVYQQELAHAHGNLGNLFEGFGKRDEARVQHEIARDIFKKLAEKFPAVPRYRVELGGSYCNLGNLVRDEDKSAESLEWYAKAITVLMAVHEKEPRDVVAKLFLRNSYWSRAIVQDRLHKHAEAVKDWDKAIELSPRPQQAGLRAGRTMSRFQAGQVTEAIAEAAELTSPRASEIAHWNAGQWYDFACVYATASGKTAPKKQEYADRAMEFLHKAVQAGYKDAAHLTTDIDLDPLHDRQDFKKLVADLQGRRETAKE
ncbi:MAG TPA: serine/threonine-protein kinase [Gemmataceae bacterium]|nr:serine/threonine-protein kinase [Gemmataceae bacterium]